MHSHTLTYVQTPLLVFHQSVYLHATKAVRDTVHHSPISTCPYGKRSASFCVARFLHGDQYRETPLARTCRTNVNSDILTQSWDLINEKIIFFTVQVYINTCCLCKIIIFPDEDPGLGQNVWIIDNQHLSYKFGLVEFPYWSRWRTILLLLINLCMVNAWAQYTYMID